MKPTEQAETNAPVFDVETGTIVFLGYTCRLELARVVTGHVRIDLIDVEDGSPVTTATKGVDKLPIEAGIVYVKDYSENKGILDVLTNAGIVQPTGQVTEQGLHVCRLLISEPPLPEPALV